MQFKIYIETSIPSFYYEIRKEPDMVARRQWTREWWKHAAPRDNLVSSVAVVEELGKGDYHIKKQCLEFVEQLPLLPVDPAIAEIAEAYIQNHVMPQDPAGDALHLALSSYHKCDFLLTWNCKNLANANKFGHIRRMNTLLGLYVPTIVTPLELIGSEGDEDDEEEGSDD